MGLNYKELGLKCGLECHQQLETGKLFCRCPSLLREDSPDFLVERRLRPTASELGEFDKAALEAFQKNLKYVYEAFNDSTCLVELDEEPPQKINPEALEIALKVSLMVNADVLNRVFVMRKAVIDGSNPSGFQRTALISMNGCLKVNGKKIGIQTIALEEDAARPTKKTEKEIFYRVDRLGIPLIELATEPQIETPEEAKEVAVKIGELFRRTCKAKRGLGTIRQDINISISNGARVEIKGVQDLQLMDEYVRREVQRQLALIELKNELLKRDLKKENLAENFVDVTDLLKKSKSKLIQNNLKNKKLVFGLRLEKFNNLLGKELQPNRRFGTELADYVKARAGLKGLLHSDELPGYGITQEEINTLNKRLKVKDNDAFVLAIGSQKRTEKALKVVIERCKTALKNVPEETRNALEDGNTCYSRPLPGAARMYPETDLEVIEVSEKQLHSLKRKLPLTVKQRIELYKKHGLSEKLVERMKLSNFACFFEELLLKKFNATSAAVLLLETLQQLKRENLRVEQLTEKEIEKVLKAEKDGKLTKDVLADVLREKLRANTSIESAIEKFKAKKVEKADIDSIIRKIVEKNSNLVEEKGDFAFKALMGEAMKELRGKASGSEIASLLREEIKKRKH